MDETVSINVVSITAVKNFITGVDIIDKTVGVLFVVRHPVISLSFFLCYNTFSCLAASTARLTSGYVLSLLLSPIIPRRSVFSETTTLSSIFYIDVQGMASTHSTFQCA